MPTLAARTVMACHSAAPSTSATSRSATAAIRGGSIAASRSANITRTPSVTWSQIGRKDFAERSGNVVESGGNARVLENPSATMKKPGSSRAFYCISVAYALLEGKNLVFDAELLAFLIDPT